MQLRKKYIVRHATQEVQGLFTAIDFRVDISTQEKLSGVNELQLNDIAQVQLKTAQPLIFESYYKNKVTGSLIFVDPFTFETVGAGMIVLDIASNQRFTNRSPRKTKSPKSLQVSILTPRWNWFCRQNWIIFPRLNSA